MAGDARKFDGRKFKELIVYLVSRGKDDPLLGAVKLNKLLFYADKQAYLQRGHSITGARYVHGQEGPMPAALVPSRKELLANGRLELESRPADRMAPQRLRAVFPPDTKVFDGEEIAVVDEVVQRYRYLDGATLTRLSHFEAGWVVTDELEDIPERTFWLSAAPLEDEQVALGQAMWASRNG
jgi:uncharacterized phage-associated protein